jgi:Electron transfer DM13
MGLGEFVRTHKRLSWIVAAFVAAAIAFVLIWFQPQKIFIEQAVDEALPTVDSASQDSSVDEPTGSDDEPASSDEPKVLASGPFQRLEHPTSGTAQILELSDGSRFLRFEDLNTSNGPDLRVYLSEIPASDDWFAYGERFIDLGALKGNQGDQNYEIPQGTDLDRFKSAVIWCRRFTVGFGVAPLT